VCRCILGFYVSYPSKSTKICLLGFHFLLIAFPSHRRRSDIELCWLLANLRLRVKSEWDSKKCILRETLHANFLQVSWSSPTNSKTARWSAFAKSLRHYFKGIQRVSCIIVYSRINPSNDELHLICHLLVLLGAPPILHSVSKVRPTRCNPFSICLFP
jgi:hypothetical protein